MENNLRTILKCTVADGAFMPERAHYNDAGADIKTPIPFTLKAHGSYVVDTGVGVQIPDGWYGKLESKSGLNVRASVVCPGGVIDAGFRGTIVVRLENHSSIDYEFKAGQKIVQLVIIPCLCCDFLQVDSLDDAERGDSGFGSTGK